MQKANSFKKLLPQGRLCDKSFITLITRIWLFSRMNLEMNIKMTQLSEGHETLVTFKSSFIYKLYIYVDLFKIYM